LQCLFLCFEVVSGLKINLTKVELVLVGDMGDFEALAHILLELLTRLLLFGMTLLRK